MADQDPWKDKSLHRGEDGALCCSSHCRLGTRVAIPDHVDRDATPYGEIKQSEWLQFAKLLAADEELSCKEEMSALSTMDSAGAVAPSGTLDVDNSTSDINLAMPDIPHAAANATTTTTLAAKMSASVESSRALSEWDRSMGLRRCHCRTMLKSCTSRSQLMETMGLEVPSLEHPKKSNKKKNKTTRKKKKKRRRKIESNEQTSRFQEGWGKSSEEIFRSDDRLDSQFIKHEPLVETWRFFNSHKQTSDADSSMNTTKEPRSYKDPS